MGAVAVIAAGIGRAAQAALERALAQPPGRPMRLPACRQSRPLGQWPIDSHVQTESHRGQAEALTQVRVAGDPSLRAIALQPGQAGGHGQAVQMHIRTADRMRAGGMTQQAQIAGHQHGRVGSQQAGSLSLQALQPVAAGLVGSRVARELDQDDQRVAVRLFAALRAIWQRRYRRASGLQHIGIDHVDARGKALGLALGQLSCQGLDHRVVQGLGAQGGVRQCAQPHLACIEKIGGRLEMLGPGLLPVGNLGRQRRHLAFANDVEHAEIASHGGRQ